MNPLTDDRLRDEVIHAIQRGIGGRGSIEGPLDVIAAVDALFRRREAEQGGVEGYVQGLRAALEAVEDERGKWIKAATKHARPDGRNSDCAKRDLERARVAGLAAARVQRLIAATGQQPDRSTPSEGGA